MARIKIFDLQPAESESFFTELTDADLAMQSGSANELNQLLSAVLIVYAISQIVSLVQSFYSTNQNNGTPLSNILSNIQGNNEL
ncbi:hypothetical protein [Chroococcidiopsis sp.]|uniref:hypothetical protein n=1 Tax=Chroococcidiopsis sp. TaxID=3088168 RepID=UPI000B6BC734|nr:hypothetical protein B7486_43465 [cyanobacterium TDX16]